MKEYNVSLPESGYTLKKTLGVLSAPTKEGVDKRITLGLWSGESRLDIRKWQNGVYLGKGISLNEDEVRALRKALSETDFGR